MFCWNSILCEIMVRECENPWFGLNWSLFLDLILSRATILCTLWFNRSVHWAVEKEVVGILWINTTKRFSNYTSKSVLNYVDMMQLFTHICEICMNNFPVLLNPTFTCTCYISTKIPCVIYFGCCCCCGQCAFPQVFKGQSFISIVI